MQISDVSNMHSIFKIDCKIDMYLIAVLIYSNICLNVVLIYAPQLCLFLCFASESFDIAFLLCVFACVNLDAYYTGC